MHQHRSKPHPSWNDTAAPPAPAAPSYGSHRLKTQSKGCALSIQLGLCPLANCKYSGSKGGVDSEKPCDIPQLVRPSQRSPSSASTFRAAVPLLSGSCRKTTATVVIGRFYFLGICCARVCVCVFFFLPSVCLSVSLAVCNSLVALRHGDSRLPEASPSPQRLRCSACSGYQLLC